MLDLERGIRRNRNRTCDYNFNKEEASVGSERGGEALFFILSGQATLVGSDGDIWGFRLDDRSSCAVACTNNPQEILKSRIAIIMCRLVLQRHVL